MRSTTSRTSSTTLDSWHSFPDLQFRNGCNIRITAIYQRAWPQHFLSCLQRVCTIYPEQCVHICQLNDKFEGDKAFMFVWLNNTKMETLLMVLQHLLSPVMMLPRPNWRYMLYTSACLEEVRGIILNDQLEGPGRLVCFWSWSLSTAKKTLVTLQRVCPVVIKAVNYWEHILKCAQFTVPTDSSTPSRMQNLIYRTRELARCRLCLFEWNFEVVPWSDVKQPATKAVSRLPKKESNESVLDNDVHEL